MAESHRTTLNVASLLADPEAVLEVAPADVPALLAELACEQSRLAALEGALAARLASGANGHEDCLLDVDEATKRLSVTRDWLRHRPELPFVVRLSGGCVRYSSRGIDEYIAALRSGRVASDT